MPDPAPKLRVIDDSPSEPAELVRLGKRGISIEPVERLPGRRVKESAERLKSAAHENFEGRSQEPGVEAILDKQEPAANIEQPWGIQDGRLAGVPYGWFVLISLALVSGGVWSLLEMRKGEVKLKVHHGATREMVAKGQDETERATRLVERVERVVADYLKAETIDEMLPLVRQPDRVRPMIEKAWAEQPRQPMKFLRMSSFEPATLSTRPFWAVRAEVAGGESQVLLVEETGDTEMTVDWETHVCWQPMPWDRFVAERPNEEALEFRVWAVPDAVYSHEFSDAGRWRCFRLSTKGAEDHLFGYVMAGSQVATELDALCSSAPGQRAAVVLRLRVPQGAASPRGVVIEQLIAPRWLVLDAPLNDSP